MEASLDLTIFKASTLPTSQLWGNHTEHDPADYSYEDYLYKQFETFAEEDFLPDPLPSVWRHSLIFLYLTVILLATTGNIIVILVIAKNPQIQTVTNRFLLSLAVSDLCIAVLNMPVSLLFYVKNEWLLGEFLCKFSHYLQGVFIVSTILTLTIVAIDRYYAILYPLNARHIHTPTRAIVVIATIWVVSLIVLSPQVPIQRLEMVIYVDPENITNHRLAYGCVEHFSHRGWEIFYTSGIFLVLYVTPVIIMIFTYGAIVLHLRRRKPIGESTTLTKNKNRQVSENKAILRMLIVIVLCFVVAWFPFFSCQIYLLFANHTQLSRLLFSIFHLVGFSNACVNPVVYCFLNDNFRTCAKALFSCKLHRSRVVFHKSRERLNSCTCSTRVVVYSENTTV